MKRFLQTVFIFLVIIGTLQTQSRNLWAKETGHKFFSLSAFEAERNIIRQHYANSLDLAKTKYPNNPVIENKLKSIRDKIRTVLLQNKIHRFRRLRVKGLNIFVTIVRKEQQLKAEKILRQFAREHSAVYSKRNSLHKLSYTESSLKKLMPGI